MMTMRPLLAAAVLSAVAPAAASAQDGGVRFTVQGAAGTQLNGGGYSFAFSTGLTAGRRVELLVSAERNHLPTDVTFFDRGYSATRGGTTNAVTGELRFVALTFDRVSPYGLIGGGAGTSRLNVNEYFPDPVTNDATQFFAGGGVRIPITEHLSTFVDVRWILQTERGESGAFLPIRGGLAWRF